VPAPHSIYEATWKLPAAHWMRFNVADAQPGPPAAYWTLGGMIADTAASPLVGSPEELSTEAEHVLKKAVQARLVSDRPVGCFLSGGIDSSMVAALMRNTAGGSVRTFTVGYEEAALNEARDAERIARHLGTEHTTFTVRSPDALKIIPRLPEIYDEPFADSSQIPTTLLAQLTAQHVTVALTGDGGDEVFGGYNRYVAAPALWARLRALPAPLRAAFVTLANSLSPVAWDRVAGVLGLVLPKLRGMRSPGDKLHKVAALARAGDERALYRQLTSLLDEPSLLSLEPAGASLLPFERVTVPASLTRFEERMMFWDGHTYLPDDILVKVDRATMSCGLEGRIPFLDNEVLRFAWRLPLAAKIEQGVGKAIVRRVLERHVPRELFDRPKAGFAVPIGVWLRGPLRGWAEELLGKSALGDYVQLTCVRRLWEEHLAGRHNHEHTLWSVLMFSAWLERWPVAAPETPAPVRARGRIVFLLNSLDGAGAEKQVVLSALALARRGYDAEIFTLAAGRFGARLKPLLRTASAAGVRVHVPEAGRGWMAASLAACGRSLRRNGPAVLWTWGHRAEVLANIWLAGLAPRISSLRSAGAEFVRGRAFWWRLFDASCARYVSNTALNVEQLAELLPGVEPRCRVLYNALEADALTMPPVVLPAAVDRLEIVMLGNVRIGVKGYDLAVETIRRLRTAGRNVRLRIAGLPIEERELRALIDAAGVGEACEFVGPVSDPFSFLRTAHVFLLFSRFEGMPNSLLEAMALGMPCISTRVGDVARFTQDRMHLRQIDVGDVAGACAAVGEAIDDWTGFRAMGAAARQLMAEKFSEESFAQNIEACVADLLEGGENQPAGRKNPRHVV
jgi:asparagine synthase (glutamine-hydrolysing)